MEIMINDLSVVHHPIQIRPFLTYKRTSYQRLKNISIINVNLIKLVLYQYVFVRESVKKIYPFKGFFSFVGVKNQKINNNSK